MAHFVKGGGVKTPFGRRQYLRSTANCQYESYTLARSTVPVQTIDGVPLQRGLQPGTAMAKITSGPDSGKIGPYQASGTAEIQTLTESGTISGGTYTLTITNPQSGIARTTAAIAYNATAAEVQAALELLDNVDPGDVVVTGGPVDSAPLTLTFYGSYSGNVAQVTADVTGLTGTTPGITAATPTPGVAGAADGRQTAANLVGLLDTWLPWQLMERDVEVSVLYHGTAVQANCVEYTAAGVETVLGNTAADAMRSVKGMDINFK